MIHVRARYGAVAIAVMFVGVTLLLVAIFRRDPLPKDPVERVRAHLVDVEEVGVTTDQALVFVGLLAEEAAVQDWVMANFASLTQKQRGDTLLGLLYLADEQNRDISSWGDVLLQGAETGEWQICALRCLATCPTIDCESQLLGIVNERPDASRYTLAQAAEMLLVRYPSEANAAALALWLDEDNKPGHQAVVATELIIRNYQAWRELAMEKLCRALDEGFASWGTGMCAEVIDSLAASEHGGDPRLLAHVKRLTSRAGGGLVGPLERYIKRHGQVEKPTESAPAGDDPGE